MSGVHQHPLPLAGGAAKLGSAKPGLVAAGRASAARALLPEHGLPGADYVLIARQSCAERDWPRLLDDVKTALIRLAADRRAEPERP